MNPLYIVLQISTHRWQIARLSQESGKDETQWLVPIYKPIGKRYVSELEAIKDCRNLEKHA
jgi:hypothetical protein